MNISQNKIKKQKEILKECSICISSIKEKNTFRCFSCKEEYCIKCLKTYLLGTTQDPHCLHCRTAIDYNTFIEKFDKTWRLGIYKEHREKILWEREQSLFPATVGYIDLKKRYSEISSNRNNHYMLYMQANLRLNHPKDLLEEEKIVLENKKKEHYKWYSQFVEEANVLREEIHDFENKKKSVKYKWSQPCPNKDCKGFLNEKYECPICEKVYCKDCLEEKKKPIVDSKGKVIHDDKEHVCNEELVETVKMIRKESRPCPTCGEFISKISGCDQMFCTGCGTAFSWTTGQREVGVIHNPHAHQFFRDHPDALQQYMAGRNGVQQQPQGAGNQCNDMVPPFFDRKKLIRQVVDEKPVVMMSEEDWVIYQMIMERIDYLQRIHQSISEYVAYDRNIAATQINGRHMDNLAIRIKLIHKTIDEKKFKMILHMRSKRNQFQKLIHELIESTLLIISGLLWNIFEVNTNEEFLKIYTMIMDIRVSTNQVIKDLSDKHNYRDTRMEISDFWLIPRYWI